MKKSEFITFIQELRYVNRWYRILLIAVLIISFCFALYPLFTQLFFYYDQARDAYEAYAIWKHLDIKIQGPATDIDGLYHGVLWYYVLAGLYLISGNNPQLVGLLLCILVFLTIPVVGYLTQKLFKNIHISIISMLLYCMMPLFQLSSRWVSNPTLALLITPLLLLLQWEYIIKPRVNLTFFIGLCYGMLIQSDLAYLLFLIMLPLYWIIFRLPFHIKSLFFLCIGIILGTGTFILVELKFSGKGINSLFHYLQADGSSKAVHTAVTAIIDKIGELFQTTILPFPPFLILLALVFSLVFVRKNIYKKYSKGLLFLLIWLSNIILFIVFNTGISRSLFMFFPSLPAVAILGSFMLFNSVKNERIRILVLVILFLSQIHFSNQWIKKVQNPLTVQEGITLQDEYKVLDYTYRTAAMQPFTINTITVPLYINTTWSYLYEFYGKERYNYLPYWGGKSQIGRLGNLPETQTQTQVRFLIMEPGIPTIYRTKIIYEEDKISDIVEEEEIGIFTVQKRQLHLNKPMIATPEALLNSPILFE